MVCIYLYTVLKVFSVHSLISILIVCGVYLLVCWTESLWCVFSCMLNWEFVVRFYLNVCDTDVFFVRVYLHAVLMSSFVWFYLFAVLMYSFVRVYIYVVLMCSFVRIYLYAVLMCSFVMSDGSVVSAHCQAALSSCCFVGMSIKTRWTLK